MKTHLKHVMLCVVITLVNILCCNARVSTSPVYINSPDSSVHAHVVNTASACKPQMGRRYYWYNMNTIISSEGGFSGRLLHGNYTSYFHNHNLKSQGNFENGLKHGIWINWFVNGRVKERTRYSHGLVDGHRELYDSTGHLSTRMYYRNGQRAGKTKIFRQDGTDSTIRYKNGVEVIPDVKNDSVGRAKMQKRKREVKTDSVATSSRDRPQTRERKKTKDTLSTSNTRKPTVDPKTKRKLHDIFKRNKNTGENPQAHE